MKVIDKSRIGKTFEIIRQNQQLSRTELIKGICNKSTYSTIENGNTDVTLSRFIKLVNRLDVDFNEFMFIANDYKVKENSLLGKKFFDAYFSSDTETMKETAKEALEKHFNSNALNDRQLYLLFKAYSKNSTDKDLTEVTDYLLNLEVYTISNFNLFHNFAYFINPDDVYKIAERIVPSYLKYKDYHMKTISYWGLILNVIDVAIRDNRIDIAKKYFDIASEEMKNTRDVLSKIFLLEHEARLLMLDDETYQNGLQLSQRIISSLDLLGEYSILEEFQEEINQLKRR